MTLPKHIASENSPQKLSAIVYDRLFKQDELDIYFLMYADAMLSKIKMKR